MLTSCPNIRLNYLSNKKRPDIIQPLLFANPAEEQWCAVFYHAARMARNSRMKCSQSTTVTIELGRFHKNSWPGFARLDSHWCISAAIYGTGGMGHHSGALKRTPSYRCTWNIPGFCLPARQPLCSKHSVPGSAPGSESWNCQNTKLCIGPGDLLAWRFPRCYPLYSHWSRGQGYRVHPGR